MNVFSCVHLLGLERCGGIVLEETEGHGSGRTQTVLVVVVVPNLAVGDIHTLRRVAVGDGGSFDALGVAAGNFLFINRIYNRFSRRLTVSVALQVLPSVAPAATVRQSDGFVCLFHVICIKIDDNAGRTGTVDVLFVVPDLVDGHGHRLFHVGVRDVDGNGVAESVGVRSGILRCLVFRNGQLHYRVKDGVAGSVEDGQLMGGVFPTAIGVRRAGDRLSHYVAVLDLHGDAVGTLACAVVVVHPGLLSLEVEDGRGDIHRVGVLREGSIELVGSFVRHGIVFITHQVGVGLAFLEFGQEGDADGLALFGGQHSRGHYANQGLT